ncbi:hypothetical protein B0H12DRAFT_1243177 [Mycena haematopus]|nr:hypothetical protein B0H12DRAFT_1243177 [Mycena haematopus]
MRLFRLLLRAAAISLEDDEVQKMLRHATKKTATAGERKPSVPSGYISLVASEEYTLSEAARLEAETESLKARLQQAKIASQSLTQAFKFLVSEIETTESDIQATEGRLSELSLKADAAILGAANTSLGLVDQCTPDSIEDESSLTVVSSVHAVITDRFQSQMQVIDAAARHLPSSTELLAECGRLDTALRKTGAEPSLNREIARLCTALEDPDTGKDVRSSSINIAAELEAAWARDHNGLLDARASVLDEAIAAISDNLLPPLTALHNNLTAQNAHIGEAQALVGALRAEIQDIVEDVRVTQEPQPNPSAPSAEERQDMELQLGLTSLLKQLKELRPQDAPPLVLLSQKTF